MRRRIVALLALAMASPCPATMPDESTDVAASASAPPAIAARLFDAFNRHDLAALQALYADDAELVSPDHRAPLRGPQAVRDIYAPLFARYPELHDRVVSMTADGERVAIEFVASGCEAPGNGCFTLPIASVLTVRAGRIVRDASYFDTAP